MKIVCTSDFHGQPPPDIPPCDLLIVAGDCLGSGISTSSRRNHGAFAWWLEQQPAETIIGIAGNHDFIAERDPDFVRNLPWIYLQDEGCVVDGVKVWGSPWSLQFGYWAFMLPEHELAEKWKLIPDDTEILVVHGPAHLTLDTVGDGRHVGSISLKERLWELPNLKLLVTGHIHESYGETVRAVVENNVPRYIQCVNASLVDFIYGRNSPIVIDYHPYPEGSPPCSPPQTSTAS